MKKYKWRFSLLNLSQATQKEIVAIQNRVKVLATIVTTSTLVATDSKIALIVAIGFAVVDTAICCVRFEEIK